MVEHILHAYDVDIKVRTEGLERSNRTGYKVNVHEITPGVVYKDFKHYCESLQRVPWLAEEHARLSA